MRAYDLPLPTFTLRVTHVRSGRFKRRDGVRKRDGRQEVGRERESEVPLILHFCSSELKFLC